MKKYSKIIIAVITCILIFIAMAFLINDEDYRKVDYDEDLVTSRYFEVDENSQVNNISIISESPSAGSIRIKEYVGKIDEWISVDEITVKNYDTIKNKKVMIINDKQAIGNVFSTVEEIINDLFVSEDNINDMIDYTKNIDIVTMYVDKPYEAVIDIYDDGNWKNIASSRSKYYYTYAVLYYVDKNGNPKVRKTDIEILRDENNPSEIAKSPLYKNYDALCKKAIDAWKNNYYFTDTY